MGVVLARGYIAKKDAASAEAMIKEVTVRLEKGELKGDKTTVLFNLIFYHADCGNVEAGWKLMEQFPDYWIRPVLQQRLLEVESRTGNTDGVKAALAGAKKKWEQAVLHVLLERACRVKGDLKMAEAEGAEARKLATAVMEDPAEKSWLTAVWSALGRVEPPEVLAAWVAEVKDPATRVRMYLVVGSAVDDHGWRRFTGK